LNSEIQKMGSESVQSYVFPAQRDPFEVSISKTGRGKWETAKPAF